MGFRKTNAPITLRFKEGHQLHGLEAQMSGMDIGTYLQVTGIDGSDGEDTAATIERFHNSLIAWNYEEEDGTPVPVSESRKQDHKVILGLSNAYIAALVGVDDADPLPDSSPSGEPSLVASIPTETLSESLAS